MARRVWQAGAITFAAVLVLTATSIPANANSTASPTVKVAADPAGAAAFWTPEKMRTATPMDQLFTPRTGIRTDVAAGTPTVVQPQSIPNGGAAWTGGGAVTKTAGRVFFTTGGRTASCSGNAVTSANKNTVITAGHCVKLQGSWHTNWVFVPGYSNGTEPYGRWAAKATYSTPQWTATEDISFDIGAAVVNPVGGRSLTDVVGSTGIAFNQARKQQMYSFGYSAAPPYDGSKLIYCSGTAIDDFLLSKGIGLTCNQTGGSSGGPWFLTFNEATGTGVQNSVNSFKYNFFPWMFGPYFGTDAQNLYNKAQSS